LYTDEARTAIVYIACRCNQNCVFCLEVDPTWAKFDEPSTQEVHREIDQLRSRGANHITFMGGETFFRKDLPDILMHAKAVGFTRLGVTTNGTILSKPGFLRRMVDSGLDFVEFSLHGHSEELANLIGGTDFTFQRQARALAEIDEMGTLPMIVNVVICRENKDHVVDIPRYLTTNFPRISARFKFKFVSLMGLAASRASEGMLRYSEVDAVAAGDYLDARGIPFWYDNFPLCRLGRHAGHSLELSAMASDERYFDYDHAGGGSYIDTGYQLAGRCWPEPCLRCTLRPVCCGIESAYDVHQGAGELSARSDDPLPLLAFALADLGGDPGTAAQMLEALRKDERPITCSISQPAPAGGAVQEGHAVDANTVRVRLERTQQPDFAVELQVELSQPDRPAYAKVGRFSLSYLAADDSVYELSGMRQLLAAAEEALRRIDSLASVQAAGAAIAAAAAALGWEPAAHEPPNPAPPPPVIPSQGPLPVCTGGRAG
jgi:organic radical activating enzyme